MRALGAGDARLATARSSAAVEGRPVPTLRHRPIRSGHLALTSSTLKQLLTPDPHRGRLLFYAILKYKLFIF